MLAPMLVQMERQIDREIAADNKANSCAFGTQTDDTGKDGMVSTGTDADIFDTDSDDEEDADEPVLMYGPQPQIITNDLKSLDEMVSELFLKYLFYGLLRMGKSIEHLKYIYCTDNASSFMHSHNFAYLSKLMSLQKISLFISKTIFF